MAIAWEGFEARSRGAREVAEQKTGEQFQLEFRVVLAAAMVRVAESDLKWHQEQAHFVRTLVSRRKVARRKKALLRASELEVMPAVELLALPAATADRRTPQLELEPPEPVTGERVVMYLALGVRGNRNVRRDLGPQRRSLPQQYSR